MAEREGFEPPVPLRVRLISSQVHSTGLCHLSASRNAKGVVMARCVAGVEIRPVKRALFCEALQLGLIHASYLVV